MRGDVQQKVGRAEMGLLGGCKGGWEVGGADREGWGEGSEGHVALGVGASEEWGMWFCSGWERWEIRERVGKDVRGTWRP